MNISISNINEQVEILFLFRFVTDDLWNKGISRISKNVECLSFQPVFTRETANLGGWGSSEYLRIVGLKDVLILRSTLVSFSTSNLS